MEIRKSVILSSSSNVIASHVPRADNIDFLFGNQFISFFLLQIQDNRDAIEFMVVFQSNLHGRQSIVRSVCIHKRQAK